VKKKQGVVKKHFSTSEYFYNLASYGGLYLSMIGVLFFILVQLIFYDGNTIELSHTQVGFNFKIMTNRNSLLQPIWFKFQI